MKISYMVWQAGNDLKKLQEVLNEAITEKGQVVSVTWNEEHGYVVVVKYERP
jgi:hypothetical protein